jgi:two-component system sensor histidine kinase DegS
MLIVVSRRLELLAATLQELPQDARQILDSLQELIRNTQRGVRLFAQGLRPPTLEHLGLVAAIRGLTNDLGSAELTVTGETRRLLPEEELVLFRIAQEAISNIRRHAQASQVIVRLAFDVDRMQMSIQDDGCGFKAPGRMDDLVSTGKLGLIGMDERARTLGGTLSIRSDPGQGTLVSVEMPMRPGPETVVGDAQASITP